MQKKFTLLQLFQIVDGRMTTNIGDIYDILNHVCDTTLYTHHLPVARDFIVKKKPTWYTVVKNTLDTIGATKETPFSECMDILNRENTEIFIPQLRSEFPDFDTDFQSFMIQNSLILNKK
jgi:hypothetical protein